MVQRPLVELLGDGDKRVNTMALEMIAYAGSRIGRERFRPFFQPGMQLALAELGRDDYPSGAVGVEQMFKFVIAAALVLPCSGFAPWPDGVGLIEKCLDVPVSVFAN